MKIKATLLSTAAVLAGVGFAPFAVAQEAETGIRAGSFIIEPSVGVETRYSDNYLALSSGEVESWSYSVSPELSLRSDWNRHALQIVFGADAEWFEANSSDDAFSYGVDAQGVIDITRAAALKLNAGYLHGQEDRGADDARGVAATVTDTDTYTAGVEGRYKAGLVRVSPFATYALENFDDVDRIGGGIANNDDRDRQRYGYGLEVGYEFLRGYEAFVRGSGEAVRYEDSLDDNGFGRDSDSYSVLVGANFQVTRLIEGRAGVGYTHRTYDDARFGDQGDIAIDVGLDWSVTPLTTVSLDASQTFAETTTSGSGGSSDRGVRLGVQHMLRENIRIGAYGGYLNQEFEGISRTDNDVTAGLEAAYIVNRHFEIGAGYDFTYADSDTVGEYTQNEVFVGLKARY